ncbi:MAG: hypothetical protein AB7K52_09675 [Phycisphaerales bacterium]
MPTTDQSPKTVRSVYADDADMGEILSLFARSLPARLETLQRLWSELRLDELGAAVRQLGREGTGCGYSTLGAAAERFQQKLAELNHGEARNEQDVGEVRRRFQELIDVCGRVVV